MGNDHYCGTLRGVVWERAQYVINDFNVVFVGCVWGEVRKWVDDYHPDAVLDDRISHPVTEPFVGEFYPVGQVAEKNFTV